MKQISLRLNLGSNCTRKRESLDELDRVVPWDALVALIAPFAPEGKTGRPPFVVLTMLRIHFLPQSSADYHHWMYPRLRQAGTFAPTGCPCVRELEFRNHKKHAPRGARRLGSPAGFRGGESDPGVVGHA